jgi:hypothetical protein
MASLFDPRFDLGGGDRGQPVKSRLSPRQFELLKYSWRHIARKGRAGAAPIR